MPKTGPGLHPNQAPGVRASDLSRACQTETPSWRRPGVKYAALSYCWGGNQPFKTTKANLSSYRTSIDAQKIPRTVRDAILVAESLGFGYLWVDAFCIVQDDDDELASELNQMAQIYRNATVTVAATRANWSDEGFLAPRDPYQNVSEDGEPLDRRAWACQERLLAECLLDFRTLETRWTFEETSGTDGAKGGKNQDLIRYRSSVRKSSDTRLSPDLMEHYMSTYGFYMGDPLDCYYDTWWHIVSWYTGKELTVGTDRLPALSAIAQGYGQKLNDEYLAGLWKLCITKDLCWAAWRTTKLPKVLVLGRYQCLYRQVSRS
jgi:hypothetical protein